MLRNISATQLLYVKAILAGDVKTAASIAKMPGFKMNQVPILEYILFEARYDDQIKKELLLLISEISPNAVLFFAQSLEIENFKKLIALGVDVNLQSKQFTLLHCFFDLEEQVEFLLSRGANLNVCEQRRKCGTILHFLLANEDFVKFNKTLDYAEKYGQKINYHLRDGEGKTLLLLAAKVMSYQSVERILKEDSSCLEIPDNEGRTPLHIACALGDCAIVELLIKTGANPNALDKLGNTPAFYAASNLKTVKEILASISIDPERDRFAQFNAIEETTNIGITMGAKDAEAAGYRITAFPAEYCAQSQEVQLLSCLENKQKIQENFAYFEAFFSLAELEHIQKFMRNFSGKTIAEACVSGHLAVIKMLIHHEADVSLLNDKLLMAREMTDDQEIAAALEKAEPAARFNRLQAWCTSFSRPPHVQAEKLVPLVDDEPSARLGFYQRADS